MNSSNDITAPKLAVFTYKLDRKLKKYVRQVGIHDWETISKLMKQFTPKQCKDRYYELVSITKEPFTYEEDLAISHLVKEYGTKWELFISLFKDRNINDIKNRYYRYIKGRNIESNAYPKKSYDFDILSPPLINKELERLKIENLLI